MSTEACKEQEEELEYLRFYKDAVYEHLGPCDSDIDNKVNEEYLEYYSKDKLPEGYN